MRRFWLIGVGGALGLIFLASVLHARPGVVVTQDGNRFEGDIIVHTDAGTVDITPRDGSTITVNRGNISSITYPDQFEPEIRRRLAQLDRNDLSGHLDLAQYAISKDNYEAARDVLLEAQKINPQNRAVNDQLDRVEQQLRIRAPATAPSAAPSGGATRPEPAQESTTSPAVAEDSGAKRLVTAEEINRIRELELSKTDSRVRVKIDADARKKFLSFTGMLATEFNRLSPVQQAYLILDQGKRDMRDGVHILNDPPPLMEFRREVLRTVVSGCATSKCHGSRNVGNFYLYPHVENEASAYTDFVILQKYGRTYGSRKFLLIDRETPAQSLLLQYLLPPDFADQPHPGKTGYRGMVRSAQDARYKQIANWIANQLPIPAPDYSFIDLNAPPTTKPAAAAAAP